MLDVYKSSRFEKDIRRLEKRNVDFSEFKKVVILLMHEKKLSFKHKNHPLKGNYEGCFDCHIKPDWILIYSVDKSRNLLNLVATGSHSDLF